VSRTEFFADVAGTLEEREKEYIAPKVLFAEIAKRWSSVLDIEVLPSQVALCMLDLKIARLTFNLSHADSIRDIAGYAAILSEINE
jgi:hypothetical protein